MRCFIRSPQRRPAYFAQPGREPALYDSPCASTWYQLLKTHQLPLDAFLVALKFMQVDDVDTDEVQCILANLIYMGHIKGYISHQHQKLVVSKQNPFPPLSTVS